MTRPASARLAAVLFMLWAATLSVAHAEPWIDAGDPRMRHDLQLLADYGVIRAPTMTWPQPWADIAMAVADASGDGLPRHVAAALARVREAADRAADPMHVEATVAAAQAPTQLRTFADTPREGLQGTASLTAMGDAVAGRLRVTAVARPDDGKRIRFDGSYGAALLGNWIVSAGYVDRWFGPGQEGSSILSTNARPIPALAIDRNHADPFGHPLLSWIGPWRLNISYGVLDDGSMPKNAHFVTVRATARPLESLELGLARVIIWCGANRPCDLHSFKNVLVGNESDLRAVNNPGNQLASLEFRYRLPPRWLPLALYGTLTAEDSVSPHKVNFLLPDVLDLLPKRQLFQYGLETWGAWGDTAVRAHIEYADTVCRYSVPNPQFGCAYEHTIYTNGYRYRGRAIGHALDGDGRMYSLGATLVDRHGDTWTGLARSVSLNMAGQSRGNTVSKVPRKLYNLEFSHSRRINIGKFDLGIGYDASYEGPSEHRLRAFAALTVRF